MIKIYTDGACSKGHGGWAFWVPEVSESDSNYAPDTTNQRMELSAALYGLQWAVKSGFMSVEIVSDSKYLVNCFNDRWWVKWLANGWVNSSSKPVANREIWEDLLEVVSRMDCVRWTWVKGHSGHYDNEVVDNLAQKARCL